MLRGSSKKGVNSSAEVIDLTRLGIKPASAAPEATALTTKPSELLTLNHKNNKNTALTLNHVKIKAFILTRSLQHYIALRENEFVFVL